MKKLLVLTAVLFVGGIALGIARAEEKKDVRVMDVGRPLFFQGLNKQKQPIVKVGDFILMLREDGLVAWRMTDEAIEEFRKEAEAGPKVEVPKPDLKSGKR